MKTSKLFSTLLILITTISYGQLKVDAELRTRSEYRHGVKTLIKDNQNAGLFTSQRTRLNFSQSIEKLNFYVSVQDIRVWGDVPQLNTTDANGLSLHQAWAEVLLDPNYSLKLGRQEIIYDDSRIFGNVGWAQQARSHDVAIFKYKRDGIKLDLGLAFNQSKENLTGTNLTTPKTYKAMQYAWLHKDWSNLSASFLFLNNGSNTNNGLKYSQTVGTHLKSKQNNLQVAANLYYQFGTDKMNRDLSAYLVGLEGNYKVSTKTKLGLGIELQSGNDYDSNAGDNNAFTPLYGTNHKFNGFMDYFYVGNHANNVGLLDIYAKANFKLNEKSGLTAFIHNFSAAADINANVSKQLGTEIDLVYGYKFTKQIGFKAGYSQMFASEGMEVLKGTSDNNTNNWAWLMVTIKPTLFTSK
ncbi:alginate export family protein [Tenacibaculum dicentrarchi]|uniref:Alginate export domain-containing protein n=1 Tax=Tenacibaculum dicentrarchi TaxID=669041 RepID=A0ABM9NWZ0_9FLAO|nr:alginate export family protein [Tenacibaculum dicentrarchi]MCD8407715.1 alginate export family protein [Tenacibaculum dicentrarchi]MCD8414953.1 alginate export family protein [Tenacibaculum dicentrarchi]MCD8420077.1 alginate export family protein [Tenacibaculum dicentrarchi]MCD8425112.1 alginate export family protein [Tenacibaculum dicentrarchi]